MINKELLSLVLGDDEEVLFINKDLIDNYLQFKSWSGKRKQINLDTLGRLCKEWCFKYSYQLLPLGMWYHNDKQEHCCLQKHFSIPISEAVGVADVDRFYGKTELEAIIKATEWVAKEKGLLNEDS